MLRAAHNSAISVTSRTAVPLHLSLYKNSFRSISLRMETDVEFQLARSLAVSRRFALNLGQAAAVVGPTRPDAAFGPSSPPGTPGNVPRGLTGSRPTPPFRPRPAFPEQSAAVLADIGILVRHY